ncbi:NADP-dependent malic enzyme [Babesia caballi]|uniref:NADP-dependent malic enzyme n=1 Tax=Babesia caballi TaxID=5871 RepID=A0AAV4LNL6_BABCB|nr:NADP-dependent malic enzyme [Babesia caballi]
MEAREPIEHLTNGCGRPGFERWNTGLHTLFSCEIAATELEERGEGVVIEGGGGRMRRRQGTIKAVVKRSEQIGVGRLCGGWRSAAGSLHGILELIKPFEQGCNILTWVLI